MATTNETSRSVTIDNNSENFSFTYDEREVNLIESLPQIYQPIYDFKGICNACGVELSKLYEHVHSILEDQFISSATADTLAKWEKYLGLTPNGTDTLDERRFRILSKINDRPPYTERYLVTKLTELCGKDNFSITKDYNQYKLDILISLDSATDTETLADVLRSIVPANIDLTIGQMCTSHSELQTFTHDYLGNYTYSEIKRRVVLK